MRRAPSLPLAGVIVLLLVLGAGPAWSRSTYTLPADARVVRGFEPPATRYGAGHRGIDLTVDPGADVRPMAAGRVTFAGPVAGHRWVTVEHPDGVRTSYGTFATVAVAAGDAVAADTVLGTASGRTHADPREVLHVSARRDGRYIDPLGLLATDTLVPTLLADHDVELHRGPADDVPRLMPGAPPSPNHLLVVAGLTSATGDLPFDPGLLGYGDADASQFSYRGLDANGTVVGYGPEDTWGRVHDAAVALREQLRAHWAATGEAVDLVGHSLGGVVALYYLLVLHDPTDPALPPIGRVATIASPLRGADLAAVATRVQTDPTARALLGLLDRALPDVDADGGVLADLTPGSGVTDAIDASWARARTDPWSGPLATGTEVLTLGALLDPVVAPHRTELPGTDHHTVLDTHGGAPTDPGTVAMLAAFLEGRPLPDASFGQHVLDALSGPVGVATAASEQLVGAFLLGLS